MKRLKLSLFLALIVSLLVVTPVFAGGHIYGVVFMDENKDGEWGNEPGVADVSIHFISADNETDFTLYSAWNDNDAILGPDMYCSHLQEEHRYIPKGCNGTFGLTPIYGWWKVYIDVPDGYALTTPGSRDDPYFVQALFTREVWDDGTEWLEFGLTPASASTRKIPAYQGNYVFRAADLQMAAMGIPITGPYQAREMEDPVE